MKTFTMLFSMLFILSAFLLDKANAQLNTENLFKAPFISAGNSQQSMQSVMQNSEKDIVFIENLGQIRDSKGKKKQDVLFLTRSQGVDMYITSSGITYVFRKTEGDVRESAAMRKDKVEEPKTSLYRLDMEFVGMNKNFKIKKELAVEQQFNYYTPEYPNGISPNTYKKITIENIYDGIDLVYYEKEGKMKYDFVVKSGADPNNIKMKYKGAGNVYIDKYGGVIVTTPMGEIREEKPYTYSRNTGKEIESRYEVRESVPSGKDIIVQFNIAEYNNSEEIIIDPYRQWATYYGGSGQDWGYNVCSDNSGNIYVTGKTQSTNFPTKILTGAYNQTIIGGMDAFILKFNSSGARIWATYYGGNSSDYGYNICTDNSDNLYVTGYTYSTNFPVQTLMGAYNQTVNGGGYLKADAFVLKFNSSGARVWATYYGGSGDDRGYSICTDNSGALYITGNTRSTNFPKQELLGAYNQTTHGGGYEDAFILKFSSSGVRLWVTYYGGSSSDGGWGICTDNSGALYVTGKTRSTNFPKQELLGAYNQNTKGGETDAFILKFNSSGVRLWATYYGGSYSEYGYGICTDNSGNLFATGYTESTNFPTQPLAGAYNQTVYGGGEHYIGSDAFILKFNSSCARLWATYYGGNKLDEGRSICLDNSGALYITGYTYSTNFPIKTLTEAYNQTTSGGSVDAFILKFKSNCARLWATYYGGSYSDYGRGICTDNSNNLYVTGETNSTYFPTQILTGGYNQSAFGGNDDVFILKFNTNPLLPSSPVLNAPTNNSTAQPLTPTPTLSWNAVSGALSYTVQVATDQSFTNVIATQSSITGLQYTVTSGILLNSTQYYWRVNATNANGTGDWSDVWNFTTIIAAPTLISPANSSMGQPLTPNLAWNVVSGALSYTVQVASDVSFTNLVLDQTGITDLQYVVSSGILFHNTQYYWRVNATNAAGTGDWSDVWNFTTIIAAPTLISPANGSAGQPLIPSLTWNVVSGALNYAVQVASDVSFTNLVVDQTGIIDLQYAVTTGTLLHNTQYYWRVNATNANGTGGWSEVWDFTTIIAAPTLVSPVNGTVVEVLTPLLDWNNVDGALNYNAQVSLLNDFSSILYEATGLTESNCIIPTGELTSNTLYYWRVNAMNAGGTSDWSDSWNFTTIIATPTLISPANGSVGQPLMPNLVWNIVSGASSYAVQVASDVSFTNLVVDQTGIIDLQYAVTTGTLLHNTQYYWRVNATNANGTGGWSEVWDFTTIIAAPTLVSPENGTVVEVLIPLLDWDNVDGALNYNAQVSLLNDFSLVLYEVTDLTESNCLIPDGELTTNTLYYWRVNAINTGGTSAWSDSWNFQTYATPSENTEMLDLTIDSMIVAGILNTGNGNSLIVILNSALDKINQGKYTVAINKLNAFINKVEAFIPKKLTPEQGQDLIDRANAIIEQLSGDMVNLIPEIPEVFSLIQNYPNPFNPITKIDYGLPFDSKVSLQIFDVLGREVVTLVDDNLKAGYYSIDFNASNLASGIYFYRMIAGDFNAIKKMVVLK